MVVTFLIGNGFDKQLGLDTGYDDFLKWYLALEPEPDEDIEKFKIFLKSSKKSKWWADAEIAMGEYLADFNRNNIDTYYKNIRDFKEKLAIYLKEQQGLFICNDEKKTAKMFRAFLANYHSDIVLNKHSRMFSKRKNTSYNFINFNYTNTLANLIYYTKLDGNYVYKEANAVSSFVGSFGNLFHVHGTLDSFIIMGVNDKSQLMVNDESMITDKMRRTVIKPITGSALGRTEMDDAEQLIRNSDILAVYGFSFGDSDKHWRDLVGEWLKISGHLLVFFGHEALSGINPLIPEDKLDYVDSMQNKVMEKIYKNEQDLNNSSIKERILIIDNTSLLGFNSTKVEVTV